MKVTKEELRGLVETCWRAAREAELAGCVPLQCTALGQVDLVRFKAFEILLTCMCPKAVQLVQHFQVLPKEPWEE